MAENVKDIKSISEVKPISLTKLKSSLKRYNELTTTLASARGALGSFVKQVETEDGVHRGAFALGAKLSRQDPVKRQDFLRSFNAIVKANGWDEEGDLIDKASKGTGNVVPIKPGDLPDGEEQQPSVTH